MQVCCENKSNDEGVIFCRESRLGAKSKINANKKTAKSLMN